MPENPSVDLTDLSEQDAMAAEWAAALEEKPSDPGAYGTPAPFADFDNANRPVSFCHKSKRHPNRRHVR